jgi:ribose transport system substrate-binding protein
MKRVGFFLLLAVVLLSPPALFAGGTTDPITIGVSFISLDYPYFVPMKTEAEKTAASLGVKLIFLDAYGSESKQTSDIATLVTMKVSGILVDPVTVDSSIPAIEKAVAAGIPVVTVDREANTDKVLAHVGPDEVEGGRAAARYLIEKLGNKGTVIELEGTTGASATISRKQGFDEVIGKSNVKILSSQDGEFDRGMATSIMAKLIKTYPKFDGVFAHNDDMIVGVIQAMSDAGIKPSTKVTVGYDASLDGLTYIKQGKLSATVATFQGQQAGQALSILLDYIKSKKKPEKALIYVTPKLVNSAQ